MSNTEETSLAEDYLAGRGGSVYEYHYNMSEGQRRGQAFFNALSGRDQELIRGSGYDTFYTVGHAAIEKAIEFLLDNETTEV